ncbi:MAG: S41 family peptidase [Janthinobacterium lividum]
MPTRTRRALVSLSLFFGTCAVAGSFLNGRVNAQSATNETSVRDSLHQFTDVYSVVEANYADKLNGEKIDKVIYDGAIPNMLHTLDPHSNFYDPKAYAQMREDQHGRYYGVGMHIQPQVGKDGVQRVVVIDTFEGSPAHKAGIRPGDAILFIDGKSADGMDSLGVSNILKGVKGTHVAVQMQREGQDKPMTFDLVRDEIPRPSVDLAYFIKPGIGYIHVTQFMETTSHEVGDALAKFGPEMTGLVIDLRGNPGGLLNEAVSMSDKFLAKGDLVVSQKGRSFQDVVYKANHGETGKKYPIVVLVNRNTASAAEIVSGALQDHDRALIVGETTFGKGLVQTVFQIAENTGLALTTYHYYTPSGRLIQRDYNGVSLYDYYYVRKDAKPADKSNLEVKQTDSGRTVYGGGGITPDEKIESPKANQFENSLLIHGAFFNFTKHYLAHRTIPDTFSVDDAVLTDFKSFLKAEKIDYTDADLTANLAWIKSNIKGSLFTSQFGANEGQRARTDEDPQILKAITFMPEALALEERSDKSKETKVASTR